MNDEEYKAYRRAVVRQSQCKRRMMAREQGLCIVCCKALPEDGKKTCKECREMSEKIIGGIYVACWLIHAALWIWASILMLKEAENDE